MTQAEDAVGQLNDIGASSAHVASVATTTKPFGYESMTFGDAMPTIHVGFVTHKTHHGGQRRRRRRRSHLQDVHGRLLADGDDRVPRRPGHVLVVQLAVREGDDRSRRPLLRRRRDRARRRAPYPGTWFRPSFLHELLHAFGLHHTSSAYAMMNHRGDDGFPWGNRADADAVRPLPDDVRLLRASYPASGTRWDVDATQHVVRASRRARRAAPPTRSSSARPASAPRSCTRPVSDGPCSTSGSTSACPGDTLYTRYALNNYSTGSVRVTSTLSLSSDETSDATDALSATKRTDDLSATTSKLVEAKWKVPSVSGAIRVQGREPAPDRAPAQRAHQRRRQRRPQLTAHRVDAAARHDRRLQSLLHGRRGRIVRDAAHREAGPRAVARPGGVAPPPRLLPRTSRRRRPRTRRGTSSATRSPPGPPRDCSCDAISMRQRRNIRSRSKCHLFIVCVSLSGEPHPHGGECTARLCSAGC